MRVSAESGCAEGIKKQISHKNSSRTRSMKNRERKKAENQLRKQKLQSTSSTAAKRADDKAKKKRTHTERKIASESRNRVKD